MKGLEEVLILESLALKRQAKLNNIAMDRYLNGFGSLGEPEDFLAIQIDNEETDLEIQYHFKGFKTQVHELL